MSLYRCVTVGHSGIGWKTAAWTEIEVAPPARGIDDTVTLNVYERVG